MTLAKIPERWLMRATSAEFAPIPVVQKLLEDELLEKEVGVLVGWGALGRGAVTCLWCALWCGGVTCLWWRDGDDPGSPDGGVRLSLDTPTPPVNDGRGAESATPR